MTDEHDRCEPESLHRATRRLSLVGEFTEGRGDKDSQPRSGVRIRAAAVLAVIGENLMLRTVQEGCRAQPQNR